MGSIEGNWLVVRLAIADVRSRLEPSMEQIRSRVAAQSTVEYALVGALVVIAAAGTLALLGGELSSVFTRITTTLQTAAH
jgi:Flp pilus assembly pilin Flp